MDQITDDVQTLAIEIGYFVSLSGYVGLLKYDWEVQETFISFNLSITEDSNQIIFEIYFN